MSRFNNALENVRVAAPCSVDWDTMMGNDRQRFCGLCQLNVYNLSEMTRSEAERFIGESEGRVCIRYYRRNDGSVITRNCPVGLQALKRRVSRIATAVVSVLITFLANVSGFRLIEGLKQSKSDRVEEVAEETVVTPVVIACPPPVLQEAFLGRLEVVPTPKRLSKPKR